PRPPAQTSGAEGVRFLLASGRQAEAELAAQTIAELIRAGDRPGEVAVVVREISEWAVLLGDVFDSCGIPYQVDCRTRLGGTGLGGAFINCLQGVMSDDAARLLAYLRSPYSGVAPSDVDDLEWRYERGTARGAGVLAALAARGCGDALRPLWGLLSSDRGACREDTGGPLLDLVEAERWARRMLVAGARGLAPGDDDLEEDIRAFRALQAAFAAMAGLVADHAEPACFEAEAALRSLAQRTVGGARPDTDDAVQLLSVHRARARRFDVVIVLGLVEGEFPGRTDRPSILSPAQRTGLSSVAGGLLTPRVDQESALFVSAVSRARRLLHLSARDAEDDGTEAVPSRFWVGAKTLLEVESQGHESRTLTDQVFTPSAAPSLRHYLRACASAGVAPDPTSGAAPFAIAERSRRRTPTRLSSAGVLEELTAKRSFSPSALERYAACPFAWFLERVVRVQEIGLELDGAAVGELLHGVLSSTYRRLAGAGLLPLRSDTVAEAERLAFAAVDGEVESDRCPGSVAQRRLAGSRLRGMVRTLFAMEISAGGGLRLSETEAEVGGSQGTDVGGLRIRGRIDRIDATPDGAGLFVIDYKSGEIPSAASMGSDAALQLPLYLLALGVERPDAQVIGGAYLSLSRNQRAAVMAAGWEDVVGGAGRGCRALDGAGMEELFRLTREHALRAAEGMRTGDISPREDRACPVWCRLGPACRSRRGGYRP
ncbi:MAG: PD-(D/E)XK nuclease family protein, partial [Thermoleophilia bacterium]|nr:PD-(D/E)XK nuclease family protein [Thermoleophilia bacterium]